MSGGRGAGVVAFDPVTGRELWKATDDEASYSSPTAAAVDGKLAAVFLTRTGLKVIDPATGAVRYELPWRPRLNESVNAATPLVWKDEIFVTVSYSTGAVLVKAKGKEVDEVWSNDKSLSCQYNTPVRVGDYLYGVHGRSDVGNAQLRCVEWKTGAVKWSEPKFGVASLLAVDGGILALTETGSLVRFDASPDGYRERGRAGILSKPTRGSRRSRTAASTPRRRQTRLCELEEKVSSPFVARIEVQGRSEVILRARCHFVVGCAAGDTPCCSSWVYGSPK